jgi:hypothetical protein
LVVSQVLQNAPYFAVFSGSCSETEVSKQLYYLIPKPGEAENEKDDDEQALKGVMYWTY